MRDRSILAAFGAALLLSISPVTADTVIQRGIDVFTTFDNGRTYYDFASSPIPAGFFCKKSPAFSGRVVLKGLPLETESHGQLRGADTVVERLDDAVFDAKGIAVTRVRVRALSLVSASPIRTPCGDFHAYISLDGKQRATTMRIHRTSERGGKFFAPVSVAARMTFVPVRGKSTRRLELKGSFNFPATAIPWSTEGGPAMKRVGPVVVDTNGDQAPDTYFSGTTNFAPGWSPDLVPAKGCTVCEPPICHEEQGKYHCTGGLTACYPQECP